jgi:Type II intron maturase
MILYKHLKPNCKCTISLERGALGKNGEPFNQSLGWVGQRACSTCSLERDLVTGRRCQQSAKGKGPKSMGRSRRLIANSNSATQAKGQKRFQHTTCSSRVLGDQSQRGVHSLVVRSSPVVTAFFSGLVKKLRRVRPQSRFPTLATKHLSRRRVLGTTGSQSNKSSMLRQRSKTTVFQNVAQSKALRNGVACQRHEVSTPGTNCSSTGRQPLVSITTDTITATLANKRQSSILLMTAACSLRASGPLWKLGSWSPKRFNSNQAATLAMSMALDLGSLPSSLLKATPTLQNCKSSNTYLSTESSQKCFALQTTGVCKNRAFSAPKKVAKGVNQSNSGAVRLPEQAEPALQPTKVDKVGLLREPTIGGPRNRSLPRVGAYRPLDNGFVLKGALNTVLKLPSLKSSHAFYADRSQHTCLKQIKQQFGSTNWYIVGDTSSGFTKFNSKKCLHLLNHTKRLLMNRVKASRNRNHPTLCLEQEINVCSRLLYLLTHQPLLRRVCCEQTRRTVSPFVLSPSGEKRGGCLSIKMNSHLFFTSYLGVCSQSICVPPQNLQPTDALSAVKGECISANKGVALSEPFPFCKEIGLHSVTSNKDTTLQTIRPLLENTILHALDLFVLQLQSKAEASTREAQCFAAALGQGASNSKLETIKIKESRQPVHFHELCRDSLSYAPLLKPNPFAQRNKVVAPTRAPLLPALLTDRPLEGVEGLDCIGTYNALELHRSVPSAGQDLVDCSYELSQVYQFDTAIDVKHKGSESKEYATGGKRNPQIKCSSAVCGKSLSYWTRAQSPQIHYVRFAHHFLIGVTGSKQYVTHITDMLSRFLQTELQLQLQADTLQMKHAKHDKVSFLGYLIEHCVPYFRPSWSKRGMAKALRLPTLSKREMAWKRQSEEVAAAITVGRHEVKRWLFIKMDRQPPLFSQPPLPLRASILSNSHRWMTHKANLSKQNKQTSGSHRSCSCLPLVCAYRPRAKNIRLLVNMPQVIHSLAAKGFCDRSGNPKPNFASFQDSQATAVARVASVLRGLANYYHLADSRLRCVSRWSYILTHSLAMMFAAKFKLGTRAKVFALAGRNLSKPLLAQQRRKTRQKN